MTRTEFSDDRQDLARRIRAAGVPIHIADDRVGAMRRLEPGLLVYQSGGEVESNAFDFYGSTGLMISVIITCNLPRFAISEFAFELPWTDEVRWLEDPGETAEASNMYRFGKNLPEFDRSLVVNHFADVRRLHARGTSIVGYLLGSTTSSIPNQFTHGVIIPAFLTIFDQFGRHYRSPISLWSDRSKSRSRPSQPRARRKALFDCRDPDSNRIIEDVRSLTE
jgi:hypothetical protein